MIFSYSFLDAYETCPWQAHEVYITKSVNRDKESGREGIEIHEQLAKFINDGTQPRDAYKHPSVGKLVSSLERRGKAQTEVKLGVTRTLGACDFFSPDVWLRSVLDVLLMGRGAAFIGDWKTGKVRERDLQLQIFSALVFANYPEVQNVRAVNLWLREPDLKMSPRDWSRDDVPELWAQVFRLVDHVERAEKEDNWPKRANALCAWCPVTHCEKHP